MQVFISLQRCAIQFKHILKTQYLVNCDAKVKAHLFTVKLKGTTNTEISAVFLDYIYFNHINMKP